MSVILKTSARVLMSWPFWLNLLVILVVTCWVPLLSQTMEMTDDAGNVLQQATITSRVYESWWIVIRNAPGAEAHRRAVGLHLGLSFAISFFVWFIRAYTIPSSDQDHPAPGSPPRVADDHTVDGS